MILVTLGTHARPMDRLVVALDELLESGRLDEEVVITAAAYGRLPDRARALPVQPFDVLSEMTRTARAIITHGGPASIALALSEGHAPIVVPRDPRLQEHVDDHQIRFANWLATRRDIAVVSEMSSLEGALRVALEREARSTHKPPVPIEAIDRLRVIISSGR